MEHYTQLDQLVFDQHGVRLSRDEMMQLVHDVGGAADRWRRAEYEAWRAAPVKSWPQPQVTPERIYVSCDGIYYCTNQREPDPQRPGENRLIWQEMKVGWCWTIREYFVDACGTLDCTTSASTSGRRPAC